MQKDLVQDLMQGEDGAINAVNEDYGMTPQATAQGQGTTTAPAAPQAPQGIPAPSSRDTTSETTKSSFLISI
jgi:hypothetical protein